MVTGLFGKVPAVWAGAVAEDLARLDPANAETYARNARALQDDLTRLEAEIDARLAPARDKPFVVFHDAYGYFTERFGLMPALSVALGDASAPGAARIAALRETVVQGGALCLFPEAQHDPALIARLAEGTQARTGATLDPSGSSMDPGPALYPALLAGLAGALADCLE